MINPSRQALEGLMGRERVLSLDLAKQEDLKNVLTL